MTHNMKVRSKDFTDITYFLQPLDIFPFRKLFKCSGRCLCVVLLLFLTNYIRENKKASRKFLVDSFPCVNLVKRENAGEKPFPAFFISDMDEIPFDGNVSLADRSRRTSPCDPK